MVSRLDVGKSGIDAVAKLVVGYKSRPVVELNCNDQWLTNFKFACRRSVHDHRV